MPRIRNALIRVAIPVAVIGVACLGWCQGKPILRIAVHPRAARADVVLENADLRKALSRLFQAFERPLDLAPDVRGSLTLKMHDATFESALVRFLARSGASCDKEGRVYHIFKAKPQPPEPPVPSVPAPPPVPSTDVRVTLDLNQADVRDALPKLFRSIGAEYSIDPDVQGAVTLNVHDTRLEIVLKIVCEQIGATWSFENGLARIVRLR